MEKVLVVKTELLAPYLKGINGMIYSDLDEIFNIINSNYCFIPREMAEESLEFKQIIPYIVLVRGNEIFSTTRLKKGKEARLHGKMSVGIGGHINPIDNADEDVLKKGMERELEEEVSAQKAGDFELIGFINDDSNGVGNVHFGICYKLNVSGDVIVKETEKLSGAWTSIKELEENYDNLETWTQIVLEAIK